MYDMIAVDTREYNCDLFLSKKEREKGKHIYDAIII